MKKLFSALLLTAAALATRANNIQVTGAALGTPNAAANTTQISFSVSWENSWRTSTNESNYDGAWIFVKYRKTSTNDWRHATINATGLTAPSGSTITVPADGRGAFIYRSSNGTGNVNYSGAQLQWNYGADGVADNDSVEIRVFAVETVYIPQGDFYLGSSGTERNHFYNYNGVNTTEPYHVVSAGPVNIGAVNGMLYYNVVQDGYPTYYSAGGDGAGPVPAAFPNGYSAFWLMKYECSQQQYVDFLNHLDAARAAVRNGNTPFTGAHPALVAPNPERAMNYRSFSDQLAYADWCGMRPYTEMEYEKACRGAGVMPVPNEYAMGNSNFLSASNFINDGGTDEYSATTGANVNFSGTPRRVGLFATSSSGRGGSGGTYYGVMDMCGSVAEMVINIGYSGGRAFTKTIHGDGNLNNSGDADIATWQNASLIIRGGGYTLVGTPGMNYDIPRVSSRWNFDEAFNNSLADDPYYGIRLARTAP